MLTTMYQISSKKKCVHVYHIEIMRSVRNFTAKNVCLSYLINVVMNVLFYHYYLCVRWILIELQNILFVSLESDDYSHILSFLFVYKKFSYNTFYNKYTYLAHLCYYFIIFLYYMWAKFWYFVFLKVSR